MEQTKDMEINTKEGSNTPVCADQGNTSNEFSIPLSQSQIVYEEDFVTDIEPAIRHFLPLPAASAKLREKLRTTPKDAKDYALIKTEYNKVLRELDVATVNLDGIDLMSFPHSVEELDEIVTRVKARRNA
ncbi:putative deoxyribonuclease TATDN2, partial [Trichonephila inaurata madagascariensis]